MLDKAKIRTIHFDLKVELLKNYYDGYYTNAYKDIKKYLTKRGFRHQKDTDYISIYPMEKSLLTGLIKDMVQEMPWIYLCKTKFETTIVSDIHDLSPLIEKTYETMLLSQRQTKRKTR
ncbi:MAG: hypothetical protein ACTTIR_07625 [Eggerthia catenaformis]|uniref:hypothetical protein n=1 Tax=Eggerthia catenaformis TaxID=31973 RepID=UPI00248E54DF|nr:hypothetical protein [Eggerthia catenaformis]